MALSSFSYVTARGSVRLRFDDGVSVEAFGRYFTLDIPTPLSVAVSERYLLFVLDGEGDNLAAYSFDGEYAFGLSFFGVEETLIGGSVMTAAEAIRFLSRYPDVKVVADHGYYLATTVGYGLLLLDLDAREVVFRK